MYGQLKSGGLGPLSVSPYVPVPALLPAFLKRKPADGPGFQGGTSLAPICSLRNAWFRTCSPRGKRRGPCIGCPVRSYFVPYARTTRKTSRLSAHHKAKPMPFSPFLSPREGKKKCRGTSPNPRGVCRFCLNETRSGPDCLYQPCPGRGCGPRF